MFFLKPLPPEAAEVVLWAHKTDFDPGEHWYEYLAGAAAEKATIQGIYMPVLREYAGFIEIFEWEDGVALESLYVFRKFRHQGIGSSTVRALESQCRNCVSIWASRTTSPFYEQLGYARDHSQGGFIMIKNRCPGRTFTQAASQYWKSNG